MFVMVGLAAPLFSRRSVMVCLAVMMTSFTILAVPVANAAGAVVTVSGGQRFQTMDGFGVSINAHSWNNGELKPALDMLVDQNGSRIFRVVMEMTDWEQTNDNTDPNTYNWV
jgi:O-glycosyl hydrolase